MQQAVVASENHAYPLAQLGHALGQSGRKDEAERILEQLTELCQGRYVPPCWLAIVCAGLGEKGAALQWLEKAYEQHDVWLVWLKTEPRYDSLRAEAQFDTLMRCVGFAPGLGIARPAG